MPVKEACRDGDDGNVQVSAPARMRGRTDPVPPRGLAVSNAVMTGMSLNTPRRW